MGNQHCQCRRLFQTSRNDFLPAANCCCCLWIHLDSLWHGHYPGKLESCQCQFCHGLYWHLSTQQKDKARLLFREGTSTRLMTGFETKFVQLGHFVISYSMFFLLFPFCCCFLCN